MIASSLAWINGPYPQRQNQTRGRFNAVSKCLDTFVEVNKCKRTQAQFLIQLESHLASTAMRTSAHLAQALRLAKQNLMKSVSKPAVGSTAFTFTDDVLCQAFGVIKTIFAGTHGLELRPTQFLAARAMLKGNLAEMATGEGKTYAAAIAAGTAALAGIPVHVMTSNEYLAQRDAHNLTPFYAALGLSCAAIVQVMQTDQRRETYASNIVYCTASEVIFDYLRDRLLGTGGQQLKQRLSQVGANQASQPVLRGLCFALIDEADSILIDDACTPFILAAASIAKAPPEALTKALEIAQALQINQDFILNDNTKSARLTQQGKHTLATASSNMRGGWAQSERYREELVTQAICAIHCFKKNVDYIISEQEVKIVDANTGRIAVGRQWSKGLHQLIEIKESISLTQDQKTIIQLTYQRFFPRYLMLCGMSGTLKESRAELQRNYGLGIISIPPFLPSKRRQYPAKVYVDSSKLDHSLIALISRHHQRGQPILIGVDSVEESLRISGLLKNNQLKHQLLNAAEHEREANIIANAGSLFCITIATNMAGRGTDIAISEKVRALGGLMVVSCQLNGARRIDRQLSGRSGRGGDPGCAFTLVSVQRELLSQFLPYSVWKLLAWSGSETGRLAAWLGEPLLRLAQRKQEHEARQRRDFMMQQDEAIERNLSFGSGNQR